jgi:subtilisin family serine protease
MKKGLIWSLFSSKSKICRVLLIEVIKLAAPFVSGVAALIKSNNLSMTPQEIRNTLDYNAIDLGDIGRDNIYGFGLVQAS